MRRLVIAGAVILMAAGVSTDAQTQTSQTKTLANAIDVYVFPTKGQSQGRQNKDEAECYGWAVDNTGVDPFEAAKQAQRAQASQQQAAQATEGSGLRGAAKGAAGGALIGAIAGNAGMGAAIGAAAGAIFGRGSAEYQAGRYQEQTAKVQQISAEQMARFRKAFSTCLEGKNYIVKY
jgi:hypothetical protein